MYLGPDTSLDSHTPCACAQVVGGPWPCTSGPEQPPLLLQRQGYVRKGEAGGWLLNVVYFRRVMLVMPPNYYNLAFYWLLAATEPPMSEGIRVGPAVLPAVQRLFHLLPLP